VYIHNTSATTNGSEECSYVVCDVKGYETWQSTASCLGRSVIVEGEAHTNQLEGDGVDPDSVRGCAFNRAGIDDDELESDMMTSNGRKRKIGAANWALLVCGVAALLLGAR